jgi:hypothetical protein
MFPDAARYRPLRGVLTTRIDRNSAQIYCLICVNCKEGNMSHMAPVG